MSLESIQSAQTVSQIPTKNTEPKAKEEVKVAAPETKAVREEALNEAGVSTITEA